MGDNDSVNGIGKEKLMTKESEELKQYHDICHERFDRLDRKMDDMKEILVGDGRRPGLADDVRDLKAFKKTTIGAIVLFVGTVFTQIAIFIRSKVG